MSDASERSEQGIAIGILIDPEEVDRTIHPATGNVVEVVSVDETYGDAPDIRPIRTVVTYRTILPTGFEVLGSYTIEPGTNPDYLPDEDDA